MVPTGDVVVAGSEVQHDLVFKSRVSSNSSYVVLFGVSSNFSYVVLFGVSLSLSSLVFFEDRLNFSSWEGNLFQDLTMVSAGDSMVPELEAPGDI